MDETTFEGREGGALSCVYTYDTAADKFKLSGVGEAENEPSLHDSPPFAPAQPVLDGLEKPRADVVEDRSYRSAFVCSTSLSPSYVEEAGGVTTRKGTPRLELLLDARAAHLTRKADASGEDYLVYHDGEHTERRTGTFVKSIQGFAEDVWRRVYKRAVPEGDPLDHGDFHRLYRRLQRRVKHAGTHNMGDAVKQGSRLHRHGHGRRWRPSRALTRAASPTSTDPPDTVLCTAQTPRAPQGIETVICSDESGAETDNVNVWRELETRVARDENLHHSFTHAVTCSSLDGQRYSANARRYERKHARTGDTDAASPRYLTIGRWRKDEIERHDRRECAVTIPWIIAEIDGRSEDGTKDRARSDRLARRLLRRLDAFGVDLSDVVVSYSGNASIHVRIPHGAVGCPIYRSSRAATRSLSLFFDRLCGRDDELRKAIDNACLRPSQLIRAIGGVHEDTGRRTVGARGSEYFSRPASFLWSLSEPQFQYSACTLPLPRRADPIPALIALLLTPPPRDEHDEDDTRPPRDIDCEMFDSEQGENEDENGRCGGVLRRIERGVEEGEPWGYDVDRPEAVGRNWAALFWAHRSFDEAPSAFHAWGMLKTWNKQNRPRLPRGELRGVWRKVRRWRDDHIRQ